MTRLTNTQMMSLVASGDISESFTHPTEGVFDITKMREYARANCEVQQLPIEYVIDFVMNTRVFEPQRIIDLSTHSWMEDPALFVSYVENNTVSKLLIDGTHRIIRRHREGLRTFLFYELLEDEIIRPDPTTTGILDNAWGDPIVDGQIIRRPT
jgi:hypothetical protein